MHTWTILTTKCLNHTKMWYPWQFDKIAKLLGRSSFRFYRLWVSYEHCLSCCCRIRQATNLPLSIEPDLWISKKHALLACPPFDKSKTPSAMIYITSQWVWDPAFHSAKFVRGRKCSTFSCSHALARKDASRKGKSSIDDDGVGTAGVTGKMTQKGGSPLALIGPVQIDKCEQPLVEPALPLQDPVNLLNAYKGSRLSLEASTACSLI